MAARGSTPDTSEGISPAPHLADPKGSIRGGLVGDSLVATARPRGHGQVLVRAARPAVPRTVPGGTTPNLTASHPRLASGDGTKVGLRLLGWKRSGERTGGRWCRGRSLKMKDLLPGK